MNTQDKITIGKCSKCGRRNWVAKNGYIRCICGEIIVFNEMRYKKSISRPAILRKQVLI